MWLYVHLFFFFPPPTSPRPVARQYILARRCHIGPLAVLVCLQSLATIIFLLQSRTPWGTAHLFWWMRTCPSVHVVLWNTFPPRITSLWGAVAPSDARASLVMAEGCSWYYLLSTTSCDKRHGSIEGKVRTSGQHFRIHFAKYSCEFFTSSMLWCFFSAPALTLQTRCSLLCSTLPLLNQISLTLLPGLFFWSTVHAGVFYLLICAHWYEFTTLVCALISISWRDNRKCYCKS